MCSLIRESRGGQNAGLLALMGTFLTVSKMGTLLVYCRPMRTSTTAAPIQDDTGRITGAVSAWQDITDIKNAARQLAHAQRMESVAFLASGVAHRFNNLLTPIIGYANLLRGELLRRRKKFQAALGCGGEHPG